MISKDDVFEYINNLLKEIDDIQNKIDKMTDSQQKAVELIKAGEYEEAIRVLEQ